MRGTIYIITNIINGKQYIGQSKEINRRIKTHKSGKGSPLVSAAIGKYGIENFEVGFLADNITTQEELDTLEEHFIKEYNTQSPNGYNIRSGRLDGVKPTRLTTQQEQEIIELYNLNVPISDISQKYNMSIGGITKCLQRNNVNRRKPISKRNRFSKIDEDKLVELLRAGKSSVEIAKVFNTSYKYIWKYISTHKIKERI